VSDLKGKKYKEKMDTRRKKEKFVVVRTYFYALGAFLSNLYLYDVSDSEGKKVQEEKKDTRRKKLKFVDARTYFYALGAFLSKLYLYLLITNTSIKKPKKHTSESLAIDTVS
jgi:activator of 2-hydroxyglutaryl-CoA dehydratase